MAKGRLNPLSFNRIWITRWLRFQAVRNSVHPLRMPVRQELHVMLPRLLPPQWATVSIFQPARAAGFPNASAQGHLLAHFARSIRPAAGCFGPERSQQAVDLTGTDGQQALAAGLFVLQPHGLEQADDFRSVFHAQPLRLAFVGGVGAPGTTGPRCSCSSLMAYCPSWLLAWHQWSMILALAPLRGV